MRRDKKNRSVLSIFMVSTNIDLAFHTLRKHSSRTYTSQRPLIQLNIHTLETKQLLSSSNRESHNLSNDAQMLGAGKQGIANARGVGVATVQVCAGTGTGVAVFREIQVMPTAPSW